VAQLKHHFLIDGDRHRAWLAHRVDGCVLIDDGETHVRLTALASGEARLRVGGETHDVLIATHGDSVFINFGGRDYEVAYESATAVFEHDAKSSSDSVARAPMPGAVVATPVAPGQQVAEGDVLIVIESMKLETSIGAPRAGVVETLHVAIGQTFDRGAPLVTLAPLPEA